MGNIKMYARVVSVALGFLAILLIAGCVHRNRLTCWKCLEHHNVYNTPTPPLEEHHTAALIAELHAANAEAEKLRGVLTNHFSHDWILKLDKAKRDAYPDCEKQVYIKLYKQHLESSLKECRAELRVYKDFLTCEPCSVFAR